MHCVVDSTIGRTSTIVILVSCLFDAQSYLCVISALQLNGVGDYIARWKCQ